VLYLTFPTIDLEKRLQEGNWLEPAELVALGENVQKFASSISPVPEVLISEHDVRPKSGKVIKLEASRSKMRATPESSSVQSETSQIRTHFIRAFQWWRIGRAIHRARGEKKRDLKILRDLADETLRDLVPVIKSRTTRGQRYGLSHAVQVVLLDVARPDSPQNPWSRNEFIRTRNYLIVVLLIKVGIRRGELLGTRVRDIVPHQQALYVMRRPDDIQDPRPHEPNAKTLERMVPVEQDLYRLIHSYLLLRHDVVRGNRDSLDFLIVGDDGTPLSQSGLNRILQSLQSIPELEEISPHVLRHTWAENCAKDWHRSGMRDEQIHRNLELLGGWAEGSASVRRYTKGFAEEQANIAGLQGQSKLKISLKLPTRTPSHE
jgi:integrase